jgi:hypothetical protein
MPFNIGDVVRVQRSNAVSRARIQSVLPQTLSVQDFQEYVVEFMNFHSERFRFGLCREFELELEARPSELGVAVAGSC